MNTNDGETKKTMIIVVVGSTLMINELAIELSKEIIGIVVKPPPILKAIDDIATMSMRPRKRGRYWESQKFPSRRGN